jgi:hypothetical protein
MQTATNQTPNVWGSQVCRVENPTWKYQKHVLPSGEDRSEKGFHVTSCHFLKYFKGGVLQEKQNNNSFFFLPRENTVGEEGVAPKPSPINCTTRRIWRQSLIRSQVHLLSKTHEQNAKSVSCSFFVLAS